MTGSTYRSIFKVPKIDWCDLMTKYSKQGLNSKNILSMLIPAVPEVLHICPYSGTISMKNFEMGKKMATVFPVGNYRIATRVSNDDDDNLINIAVNVTIF